MQQLNLTLQYFSIPIHETIAPVLVHRTICKRGKNMPVQKKRQIQSKNVKASLSTRSLFYPHIRVQSLQYIQNQQQSIINIFHQHYHRSLAYTMLLLYFGQMLNPFEDSNENSIDEHDTSLPICFGDPTVSELNPSSSSQLSSPSPIAFIDLDRLSEKLSNADASESDMRSHLKQVQQMMKELKVYTECLQNRNLQMALQLQRQRMRNQQILNTLTFLKQDIEQRNASEEERQNNETVNYSNYVLQKNKADILESEAKSLKLENTYLKELILIANDNYEKLELKNREILESYYQLEQEKNRNQIDMVKKTEEIKNMFATIVIEKNQQDRTDNRPNRREEPHPANTNSPLNFTSSKSTRKEPVEDAYRQLFLKTLKPKKENRPTC